NGSTFGGNPAVCAGALANISRLDDAFLATVQEKSAWIFEQFQNAPGVKSISGLGLMIGIEPEQGTASAIANACLSNGVLVLTAGGNKVRLLPPLNISMEELKQAVAVIKTAFAASGKE
ncbi:MAG: aminotransferase class III-fold pyridoxal phosphate-dependent enzyme, partial [Solobacterium sp.]|nr:aminotransferase class III-fold pyridoxal phosphate-dependent enzyme [Solobacterium sp.]